MAQTNNRLSTDRVTNSRHPGTLPETRLALAEERERRRIACGLHDDVGQVLALLHGKLGELAASEISPEKAQKIQGLRALVLPAIEATRTLTFELASPVLYELGLEPALKDLGERLQSRHGVRFRLEVENDRHCAPEEAVLVILYRCIRELLRNVSDHAQASEVRMRLTMQQHKIKISVEDDGKSFDPTGYDSAFTPSGRYGLYSVRQQVRQLDGRFKIIASPGNGTRIVIAVPIFPAAAAERRKRPESP